MVSPEKTLTDGQENQKGDGGQQSEGEGERAGEDLGETRPLIQISDGVMTLKTFAVLIVIFFLIVIMITMPYTDYLRKVVALTLQKKGELLLR